MADDDWRIIIIIVIIIIMMMMMMFSFSLLMKRNSGVAFDKYWPSEEDYRDGFLSPSADHWLGLDRILELGPFPVRLRIDMTLSYHSDIYVFVTYDFFLVDASHG